MRIGLLGALAATLCSVASWAQAVELIDGGPGHLANATNFNGFEDMSGAVWPNDLGYTEGGIVVLSQTNGPYPAQVATENANRNGNHGWYDSSTVFTKLYLSNHAAIDEIQWKANSFYPGIVYKLWYQGHLVEQNHFSGGGNAFRNYGMVMHGQLVDEVWLTAAYRDNEVPFAFGTFNALAMDDVAISTANPPHVPVPEPQTWALLLGGFALTGMTLRTRRNSLA